MAADRPCAWVVSLLLGKPLKEERMLRVRQAFATALTHPIEEVRWYATWGIDRQFWAAGHATAMRCVNAIATEAAFADTAWELEESRPYRERRQLDDISAEAATTVRQRFWEEGAIAEDAHRTVDLSETFGAEASARMLAILGQVPEDSVAIATFARASRTLVNWWDAADDPERRHSRNFHTETAMSGRLQQFVMQASPTSALAVLHLVLEAIDRHPREIHSIIQGLTTIEDARPNTPHYWHLWGLFADGVKRAKWVSWLNVNDGHPAGSEMLAAIFLTLWWKDNVRHWRSLEGYAHHVHVLFEACQSRRLCSTITCASSITLASNHFQMLLSVLPIRSSAEMRGRCSKRQILCSFLRSCCNAMFTEGRWS